MVACMHKYLLLEVHWEWSEVVVQAALILLSHGQTYRRPTRRCRIRQQVFRTRALLFGALSAQVVPRATVTVPAHMTFRDDAVAVRAVGPGVLRVRVAQVIQQLQR